MEQRTSDGELVPEFREDKPVKGDAMCARTMRLDDEPREVIALEQMRA